MNSEPAISSAQPITAANETDLFAWASDEPPSGMSAVTTNTDSSLWPTELTPRLRVLLHTLPLDALRRSDALRDPELRHYDGLALALRVLDVVIDRMGLETEADREIVARALRPALAAMDAAAGLPESPDRHRQMIDKLLAGLRNDGDARRPFREEYTAIDSTGQAQRLALEFRLLADTFHPSGRTVLRPSDEACNLYLRLLDCDVEDAHAAAEAVVESQLARGRFAEAVHSAKQARIQSLRFQEKVMQVLRETRRDVDRVDWSELVPTLLDDAVAHLERRFGVERGILVSANERLERLTDDEPANRQAVVQVVDLTNDCLLRHSELHLHLMGARTVFLEAQARQAFAPGPSRPLPELRTEVLDPLLDLPVKTAEALLTRSFSLFTGPRVPTAPDLSMLVASLLQPRRPLVRRETPVEPIDPIELEAELRRYPPLVRAAALEHLRAYDGETRLSILLAEARTRDYSEPVVETIALLVLQAFASEEQETSGLRTDCCDGLALVDPALFGNDLLVTVTTEE